MNLKWENNDDDEYVAKSGYYRLVVEQWGRRNFSWQVIFKERIIAYCEFQNTVRTLVEAKERCRYNAEQHYKKHHNEKFDTSKY